MSKPLKQSKIVLVFAFMYNDLEKYKQALSMCIKKFGKVEIIGSEYDFSHSNYYSDEMGMVLKKRLVVFGRMINRGHLVRTKKIACKIENRLVINKNRTVNIDPGALSLENFILLTNKNFTHRVFISQNVFADLTLIYKKGKGYTELPWTYSDYASKENTVFLNKIRAAFYSKLLASSPFGKTKKQNKQFI